MPQELASQPSLESEPAPAGYAEEVTHDALAAIFYELVLDYVPARILSDLVAAAEKNAQGGVTAYVVQSPHDHLVRFAIELAERVHKCAGDVQPAIDEDAGEQALSGF